tara:strand:+ start:2758 stop:4245 length:1488 start_codon:yes stop_codon:yes gene_type:complete
MGYRFSKGIIRKPGFPNPQQIVDQIGPAAEEVAGRLNDHNFVTAAFPAARRANAMLYDFHFGTVASDTGIHTNVHDVPTGTDPNAFLVPDGGAWAPISDITQAYSCGQDSVWAIGWCQYGLTPSGAVTTFDVGLSTLVKPRVQFALRINGVVIANTVTGIDTSASDEAPRSVYPVTPVNAATPNNNLSTDTYALRGTGSMNWHVRSVRLQAKTSTPQGTATVELVVRRIPPNDVQNLTGEIEPVYIYNRTLLAIQLKESEAGAVAPTPISGVSYPVDGSPVSQATLTDGILLPLRNNLNALPQTAIAQWGLRREQIPGQLQNIVQATCSAGTATRIYPGWGSTGTVGAGQWDLVTDGVDSAKAIGPWNFSTTPAFVLVLANVAHKKASDPGIPASAEQYGVYGLSGKYSTGVYFKQNVEEFHINNPNITPPWTAFPTATMFDCDTDVQLMGIFDYRTVAPANVIDSFQVLSTYDASGGGTCTWSRASIQVYIWHP